jgi:hypothetical protein
MEHGDAFGAQRVIAETLRRDRAQSRDDGVAERASREDRVHLDQGHGGSGLDALHLSGANGAGEAAADSDEARPPLRDCRRRSCEQRRRSRRSAAAQKCAPR